MKEEQDEKAKRPARRDAQGAQRALRRAEQIGYLLAPTGAGLVEMVYRAELRDSGRPVVIVREHDCHLEIVAQLHGPRLLTDAARDRIFRLLVAASLPGATILCSNARLATTRVGLSQGHELAKQLRALVEDPRNLREGMPREWARCEATIRADGSVRHRQRGITRGAGLAKGAAA